MSIETADKMLVSGKAVNFLKKHCNEHDFLFDGIFFYFRTIKFL